MSAITIQIGTGDARIWHSEKAVAEIAYAMSIDSDITVDMLNEGPCLTALGLYNILDLLCKQFSYDKKRITINLGNQLESHNEYNVIVSPTVKWIDVYQEQLKKEPAVYKEFSEETKHFGHFISHGTRNRLLIGSTLYAKYYEKTIQTYHCNITDNYHKASIFLDDLMFSGAPQDRLDDAYTFLTRHTPIKLDIDKIETYPIRDHTMFGIAVVYPKFFVDIVSQTYCQGATFYIDEKMWRPIMTKTPFIIQGPQNFITNLHKLGFKSFNRWWDESYSYAPWNTQPYDILKIIDNLSNLSIEQLANIYEEMKLVLDYNYEKFINLTGKDFENFRI